MSADSQLQAMNPNDSDAAPTVSVILPFFNAAQFLAEAIESVLAQTYRSWELMLVDDGSTDESTRIALDYSRRYPLSIRYVEHPGHANRETPASRNLGIRHARGNFIAPIDSDDLWLPGKLTAQMELLESHPDVGFLFGRSTYWHSWSGLPSDREKDHTPEVGIPADIVYYPPDLLTLLYPLGKGPAPCPCSWLLRREVVERVGGFEEEFRGELRWYEDQAFLSKVYLSTPVFVSSQNWDKYRIHPGSCSSIGARGGRYSSVRMYFLRWFERYLERQNVSYHSVHVALADALRSHTAAAPEGWSLRVAGKGSAHLTATSDDGVRVSIERPADIQYDIQLNRPRLAVRGGDQYVITLAARSDGPRMIHAGFAQAHHPWEGLGVYAPLELSPEWQDFRIEFTATSDDANGRIHFDLGGGRESAEFRSVHLLHMPDGVPVRQESLTTSAAPIGPVVTPETFGTDNGRDRSTPIDRYYVSRFVEANADALQGSVLEIHGGGSALNSVISDRISERQSMDAKSFQIPPMGSFDCILVTHTLEYAYDALGALRDVENLLKPGGTLLAAVLGINRTSDETSARPWYWNFTALSARRLSEEVFPPQDVRVSSFGNVLSATSLIRGVPAEELTREELDYNDPGYEVVVGIRATKSGRF